MTERNIVIVSVIEYDLGIASHIGIRFSGDEEREINFGAFRDGSYEPRGLGDGLTVGYIKDQLDLPYTIAATFSFPVDEADAAYDQIVAFGNDLAAANVPYVMVPLSFTGQANSNSAAAFALAILGIDHKQIDFQRWTAGSDIDLSNPRFGLNPLDYYTDKIYNRSEFLDFQDRRTIPGVRNRSPDPKAAPGMRRRDNPLKPGDDVRRATVLPSDTSATSSAPSAMTANARVDQAFGETGRASRPTVRSPDQFQYRASDARRTAASRAPARSAPRTSSRAAMIEQHRLRALETETRRVRPSTHRPTRRSRPQRRLRPGT